MKEKNEDVRNAKSLYAEYKMLKKRMEYEGIPEIEKAYHSRIVNSIKSRINFSLLEPHKKEKFVEDDYAKYRA